jgi:hypothetical protein
MCDIALLLGVFDNDITHGVGGINAFLSLRILRNSCKRRKVSRPDVDFSGKAQIIIVILKGGILVTEGRI